MRRAVAWGLVLFVAMAVVGSASARTPQERAHIQARASLDRALAIFRGQGTDPRGATMALLDLRKRMGSLTPAERKVARLLLARPTDGGRFDWTAPASARKHFCATNFCVHWVTKTSDAPSLHDGNHNHRPDYVDNVIKVMNTVWNKEIHDLQYLKPKSDSTSGPHHGGNPNGKIDIYLQDVGGQGFYGYCTTDDPALSHQNDVSGYCVFDDDFSQNQFPGVHGIPALKVTAAHEFNHAIQFHYDAREDRWLLEATATNMEASVFPSIHDNYQYFPSSPLSNQQPWHPIDQFQPSGTNQYGVWIFFHFLCLHYGNCDIVREIWEDAAALAGTKNGKLYSTQAVEQAISDRGDSFADIFRQFGVANQNPATFYSDGAGFGSSAKVRNYGNNPMVSGFLYSGSVGLFHMANDYVKLVPGAGATTMDLSFDLPALPGAQVTAVHYDQNGVPAAPQVPTLVNGDGTLPTMNFSTANTSKVVLIFTNANTDFLCGHNTNYSCHGVPQGDSSTADYTFHANVP